MKKFINVIQVFNDNTVSEILQVEENDYELALSKDGKYSDQYWRHRVNVYKNGIWSHVAHVNTLKLI